MNMTVLTPIILLAASVAAMGCAYSALPSQRWWSHPLRPFPAHATAALAAMVALRGWIDVLGALHGGLAWLSTLGVPLAVLFFAAATPRVRSRKSENRVSHGVHGGFGAEKEGPSPCPPSRGISVGHDLRVKSLLLSVLAE
jgi:hypothetical protein